MVIDLYAGAGGMSLGFEQAGFQTTHMVEFNRVFCNTLRFNFPNSKIHNIYVEDLLLNDERNPSILNEKPDVIHGSVPCKGFLIMNRNGGANNRYYNDETFGIWNVLKMVNHHMRHLKMSKELAP